MMTQRYKQALLALSLLMLSFIVLQVIPKSMASLNSRVVRTPVGSFTAVQTESARIQLEQGTEAIPVTTPEPLPVAETFVLEGAATQAVAITAQSNQVLQFDLQFSGTFPVYHQNPCFSVSSNSHLVYVLRCEHINDTALHTVRIPVSQLAVAASSIAFTTDLPPETTVAVGAVRTDVLHLWSSSQLTVKHNPNLAVVKSSIGSFRLEADKYVFDTTTIETGKQSPLTLTFIDKYGRETTQQLEIVVMRELKETAAVEYFPEPEGSYHALVQLPEQASWYEPHYYSGSQLHPVPTQLAGGIAATQRYSEPISLLLPSNELFLFDELLRPYTVIETK